MAIYCISLCRYLSLIFGFRRTVERRKPVTTLFELDPAGPCPWCLCQVQAKLVATSVQGLVLVVRSWTPKASPSLLLTARSLARHAGQRRCLESNTWTSDKPRTDRPEETYSATVAADNLLSFCSVANIC